MTDRPAHHDRPALPHVIAIPVLDEAAHLGPLLAALMDEPDDCPIWIIDGGSTDGSIDIATKAEARSTRISVFHNPERVQAAAMNIAARRAAELGAHVLVRMDAHAGYPRGFAARAAARLADTGADSLVVPLLAKGGSGWQAAAAVLQTSWLGHGGAAHRRQGRSGWVAHGHHAAVRLDRFLWLNGYDARFAANEDAEFDLRLAAIGGRIWLEADLPVAYLPRNGPRALWRQMRRNGRWRMETAVKHETTLALRQRLPVGAALSLFLLPLGALGLPAAALPGGVYLATVIVLGLSAGGLRLGPAVIVLALVSHLGFATGVLQRVLGRAAPAVPLRPGRATG